MFLREYQFIVDNAPVREDCLLWNSRTFYKWDKTGRKCLNASQKNGNDCGIFLLKFAELCVEFGPDAIIKNIKKNLPDRQVMRRKMLGLYAKYRSGFSVTNVSSLGKRATNDDGYGSTSDVSFKRVKTADRDRNDIILRTDLLPKPPLNFGTSNSRKLPRETLADEEIDSLGKSCTH